MPEPTVQNVFELEVFFDSACPMCARATQAVRTLKGAERIKFTDIASPLFSPHDLGISLEALEGQIHGRVIGEAGWQWVVGVDVFRIMYEKLSWNGLRFAPLVTISRLPGISGMLTLGYQGFAKIRVPLGNLMGRPQCEGSCKVGT